MRAMVMAAGVGTRLRPLTCQISKPMVPVVNKPVIEHVLNLLKRYDIHEVVLNLHYYPETIKEYFGDGSKFGIKMNYSYEEKLLGTAGGVKKVENFFEDTFIVLSGDGISNINIKEAVEFHKSKKALATIVLKEVDYPLEYGVVIVDDDGRITRFLEKPNWGEVFSNTANTGVYIFEPEIFDEMPFGEEYDFGCNLFPKLLAENQPIYGFITSDYWCDIGDLPEYRQTHYDILMNKANIKLSGKEIAKDVWIGEGTKIHPKAKITGPVLIGKNCTIEEDVEISEYTTIADNSNICRGSSLKRCIIWSHAYISEYNELRGCVIGRNCFLEASCTVFEGAVLGDNCTVGEKAIIKPNVKVWPSKIIETGVTLSTSLIWGEKWRKNLFGSYGVSGKANVEITPEFATKLGQAFGTCLGKGSSVIISACDNKMCKIIKRVIEGGLICTGVNVHNAGSLPSFLNRYRVRDTGIFAGMYIDQSVYDPHSVSIEFINAQGLDIDRSLEKKIEKVFFREEFVRALPTELGKISDTENSNEKYLNALHHFVDIEKIKNSKIKIVMNILNEKFSILNHLLNELKDNVITLNDPDKIEKEIIKFQAQLGIIIDTHSEKIKIFDEKGNEIDDYKALVLILNSSLKNSSKGNIALPINIPSVVEKIVEKNNRKLFWTKTQSKSLMKASAENEVIFSSLGNGKYIFPKFQPVFDPIAAALKLIEFITSEEKTLSVLCDELPAFYLVEDKIDCPWEYKGKILQDIIQKNKDHKLELIDGVKISFSDREWILILPDTEEPLLHLWVEAETQEKASDLAEKYRKDILALIKKN